MSGDAQAEAARLVAAVRDDPRQRLRLAASFYDDRTGRARIPAYRRAEVAFRHGRVRRAGLPRPPRPVRVRAGGPPAATAASWPP